MAGLCSPGGSRRALLLAPSSFWWPLASLAVAAWLQFLSLWSRGLPLFRLCQISPCLPPIRTLMMAFRAQVIIQDHLLSSRSLI